jgi:hypothetical protein
MGSVVSGEIRLASISCPECGGKVAYDLACHTWPQRRDDGSDAWMSCMGCDSAIEYFCTEWLRDLDPGTCGWRYTHGLNSRNPRSAANEAVRPAWLEGHALVQGPLRLVSALPGIRMLGADDEDD